MPASSADQTSSTQYQWHLLCPRLKVSIMCRIKLPELKLEVVQFVDLVISWKKRTLHHIFKRVTFVKVASLTEVNFYTLLSATGSTHPE